MNKKNNTELFLENRLALDENIQSQHQEINNLIDGMITQMKAQASQIKELLKSIHAQKIVVAKLDKIYENMGRRQSNDEKQPASQKVLFMSDVENMIGRSRVTLRRWWMSDKFPRPAKLNESTLAWSAKDIESWIEQNIVFGEKEGLQ